MIDPKSPFSHLPWLEPAQNCKVGLLRVPSYFLYGVPQYNGFNYVNFHLYLTGQSTVYPQVEAHVQQLIAMGHVDTSNQGLTYD